MKTYKRYQIYSKNGIIWSNWFPISENATREEWQVKNKLKNEYKYE